MNDVAVRPWRTLELCAGVGGLGLGVHIAEPASRCVAYVEREAFAAANLVARMEAGDLAPAAIWSDLTTFDARAWRGAVDCVVSGDPCQPNSVAGKRGGADDDRFLIEHVVRVFDESGADRLFRENVTGNADGQLEAIVPALERSSARATSAPATGGNDCSSWPTATTMDSVGARNATSGRKPGSKHHSGVTLNDAILAWATPQARDHFPPHSEAPIAAMKAEGHGMRNLNDEAAHWETPGVAMTEGSRQRRGGERSGELLLTGQAIYLSSRLDPPTDAGSPSSPTRRSLNPLFVEWLMGWPIGWTDCAPAATASSRWWQLMRGALSRLCSTKTAPAQGRLL